MEGLKVMSFEAGHKQGIKCRFISQWFKIDTYVPCKERLLSEIEKNQPDVVVIDPDLYARIDGIETTSRIRQKFKIPIMYK